MKSRRKNRDSDAPRRKKRKVSPVAAVVAAVSAGISSGYSSAGFPFPSSSAKMHPAAAQAIPCIPVFPQKTRYPTAAPRAVTSARQPVIAVINPMASG